VWNTNKHSGLVGVFHLQGAAWSRRKRQFLIHDATPPPLSTSVRVADVEPLLAVGSPADKCAWPCRRPCTAAAVCRCAGVTSRFGRVDWEDSRPQCNGVRCVRLLCEGVPQVGGVR
jgi:Raffinose synthase or seed imbibition protein Sip1